MMPDLGNYVVEQIGAYFIVLRRFLELTRTGLGCLGLILLILAACGGPDTDNLLTQLRLSAKVEKSQIHRHGKGVSGPKVRPSWI